VATTIGKGITIKGTVHCDEPIEISGSIAGDVFAGSNAVTVTAEAHVEGAVTAREVVVHGTLSGRVIATDMVRLEADSTVIADVASPKLAILDGAIFRGKVEPARAEAAARVAAYRQGS
jgi:cytoskeletal protein CcmA (bactofilin family)